MQKARRSHAGAMWHVRPRGRATWTHAAPTWRYIHIYLFIYLYYIKGVFSLPYVGRVINSLNCQVL